MPTRWWWRGCSEIQEGKEVGRTIKRWWRGSEEILGRKGRVVVYGGTIYGKGVGDVDEKGEGGGVTMKSW